MEIVVDNFAGGGGRMEQMTSDVFKLKAIRAVADTCEAYFHEKPDLSEVQLVWYAHVFRNKKAMLIVSKMKNWFFEVTWNDGKQEMYVGGYEKVVNARVKEDKEYRMTFTT